MRTKRNRWSVFLSALATLWLLFAIIFNIDMVSSSIDNLGDFGSFIASGLSMKDGTNPYDTSSPLIFEADFPRVNAGGKMPNLNPPFSLLIFEWISTGDHFLILNIWRVVSSLIYVVSFFLLANEYRPGPLRSLWVFSLAGLWHTIGLGQIYTLLLLLATLAWLSLRKNKGIQAGIFLGLLVSIKPNFIVWVLLLAFHKKWKLASISLATILACGLLPLLSLSPEIYTQWLDATRVDSRVLIMPGNSSLFGLTSRLGFPELGAFFGVVLLGITLLAIYRKRNDQIESDLVNSTGIFLSLLLSPISWVGYTILTIPFFLSERKWNHPTLIAAVILTLPFTITMHLYYYYGQLNFIFWGWWYGIALAICFAYILILLWKQKEQAFNWV